MDRETAVRMWREVTKGAPEGVATGRAIESFAALIEAAERERCLHWCDMGDKEGYTTHHIREGTPITGPNA